MRLLLGGLLDFNVGRALTDFVLEFVAGLLEFSQALTNPAGELREFLRPKKEDDDNKNEQSFGPTGHT